MPTIRSTGEITNGDERWFKLEALVGSVEQAKTEAIVITTSDNEKAKLLGSGCTSSSDFVRKKSEEILGGIQNAQIAALFGYKATAVSKAPFRLIKRITPTFGANHRLSPEPPVDSFIALSYCWHNKDWAADGEPASGSSLNNKIPISPVLFEAVLEQRISGDEGIWVDQLCINQVNEEEKAMAIGAMDVIYRRARLVAVVLEDITIDEADEAALRALMEAVGRPGGKWSFRQPENLEPGFQLTRLAWKIFSARWFTRAWCGHELLMSSSNQVFFIRSNCANKIAKISLEFLYDLAILAKAVSSFIAINKFEPLERAYEKQFSRFYSHATYQLHPRWTIANKSAKEDEKFALSYMRVFSQIFGYDASVVADKLSIVLNVLQCGLFFKGSPSLTAEQCCYIFYHIALAARDPTSLSLCGQRLQQKATWMRWPRGMDITEPYFTKSRHLNLEQIPKFDDGGIQLDMVFFGSSKDHVNRVSSDHTTWAQLIIKKCAACIHEFPSQGSEILHDISRQPPTGESLGRVRFYTELLASIHECGVEWLVQSWRLEEPDFDEETEQSIRRVMQFASAVCEELSESELTPSDLFFVIEFLDGLLNAWVQVESDVSCRPARVQITDNRTTGVLLFLCPKDGDYAIAVPSLLLRGEYRFLKRIWFLVPASSGDGVATSRWNVIGKSSSFGAVDLRLSIQMAKGMKGPQIICG